MGIYYVLKFSGFFSNNFLAQKYWVGSARNARRNCVGIYVQIVLYCLSILTKTETFRQILIKLWTIKFNENPFVGSMTVTYGERRTDTVKLEDEYLQLFFVN
jgi:hypothetical protein